MALDPSPSPATLDKAVQLTLQKMKKHVRYGTAVYESSQYYGIEPSVLYREMSRRSAVHRKAVAEKRNRGNDRRAA